MKVIGAGLPRTATLTQKVALEMLGLGPCYHMVTVLGDLDEMPKWRRALDGAPDWNDIFTGFESTVDWPGGFFWRELIDVYPDAKVLLSERDGEAWERSMRETVWGVQYGDSLSRHLSSAMACVNPEWAAYMDLTKDMLWRGKGTLAERHEDRQGLIESMERHNDAVKRGVPAERLLVWQPADGWEPLCDFLGVPVPEAQLPRVNDSAAFGDRIVENALGVLQGWWTQKSQGAPAPA